MVHKPNYGGVSVYLPTWNVGLDIQNGYFCALAVCRRRYGWQLRNWWYEKLPDTLFSQQGLLQADILSKTLLHWQHQLPKRCSLRIALPSQWVLQQSLPVAEQLVASSDLDWFVEASLNKLFPLPASELAFDYRCQDERRDNAMLLVTATRKSALASWLQALNEANLTPQVVDIAPSALRLSAQMAQIPRDCLLLHNLGSQWLLVSPLQDPCSYTFLDDSDNHLNGLKNRALDAYHLLSQRSVNEIAFSGTATEFALTEGYSAWSPFVALQQMQPPLPPEPSLFTIACGLALRPEDGL